MLAIAIACAAVAAQPIAQSPSAAVLLDSYAAGDFDFVVAALDDTKDFDDILNQLKKTGPAWIAAGTDAAAAERRRLAAATFALEAARAGEMDDWKLVQTWMGQKHIYWHAPPQFIQWGAALIDTEIAPTPIARAWYLAAVAVAERSEDHEFLIGSPFEPRGNPGDEYELVKRASGRFPGESRFALAQGIALEWQSWPERPRGTASRRSGVREARQVFESLSKDPGVGAEASVRLGVLAARSAETDDALKAFDRAEKATRDPFLLYLARYYRGQIAEKKHAPADAESEYRKALVLVPRAQSASISLAALLFARGARAEAAEIVTGSLSAHPQAVDPVREYAHGDDRFWPQLIGRLRAEINPEAARAASTANAPAAAPSVVRSDAAETRAVTTARTALDTQTGAERQQPAATFRTASDLVTIDVSVRVSGTPVAGLKPWDFVLLDNGVRQTVESIEMEAVPADITILVDTNAGMADYLKDMSGQVERIAAMVRPDDRLRILAIDTYVTELLPLQPAATRRPLGRLQPGGLSSSHDALAASLMLAGDGERRNLIIAVSDTIDTMSTLPLARVRDIAKQSTATAEVAWVTLSAEDVLPPNPRWFTTAERLATYRCAEASRCSPTHRFWLPFVDPPSPRYWSDFELLRETIGATGGEVHPPGVFTDRTAAAIFKKVYDDYRRRYLLRYSLQGVKREGWHDVSVTVPAYPGYKIGARKGYAIEAPPLPVAPAPPSATPSNSSSIARRNDGRRIIPPSLSEIIDAYGRGNYDDAQREIWSIADFPKAIKDLRDLRNPWPGSSGREGVFALELAQGALASHSEPAREAAYKLIEDYAKLLRRAPVADAFERDWTHAATALLEGWIQPGAALSFVEAALKDRMPDDPRLLLAQGILADQFWPQGAMNGFDGGSGPRTNDVISGYEAAIKHRETMVEARVREGWFLYRVNRPADALTQLNNLDDSAADPAIRFYHALFLGHTLDALNRRDAAIDAYRSAVAIAPASQAAKVALMNALVRRGDRDEVRRLAETIQTSSSPTNPDPWWLYWHGDYRLYPQMIARLREAVR